MRANQKNAERPSTETTWSAKTTGLFLLQPTANRIPRRTEVTTDGTWIHFKKTLHQLQIRQEQVLHGNGPKSTQNPNLSQV
jgi:hypothetical protein